MNRQAFLDTRRLAGLALLGTAFWICYQGTLIGLWHVWQTDGDYSYAPVLPLISGWLIWTRRRQLAKAPVSTCWAGGIALGFLLIVSVYGILGSSPSAVRPAIPLALLAITLFCYGKTVFRQLFFPFFLLIFTIPLPTLVETRIGVPLKIVSTKLGEGLLKSADVSVFVEGNVIDLGVTQLQVVDACSGLRYILPLLALGVIFAYFFEKNRLKQFLIAASTVPIAIFANGFRIAVTGYLAQNFGAKAADGFFHGFSGWLIFVFALALMMGFYSCLRLVKMPAGPRDRLLGYFKRPLDRPTEGRNTASVMIATLGLLSVGLLNYATASFEPFRLKSGFSPFPLTIGPWQGRTESIDSKVIELSGAEEALNAAFSSNQGDIVSLYIGYRGAPFNESENFFHSPNVCLPSAGWKTLSISSHTIGAIPKFGRIEVRKMVIEKMGLRQLVYYWFQTKNRVSSDVHINRFHLTMHAIGRSNTYDLFIRPITPIKPSESLENAQARLDQFTRQMMNALFTFLSQHQTKGRAS